MRAPEAFIRAFGQLLCDPRGSQGSAPSEAALGTLRRLTTWTQQGELHLALTRGAGADDEPELLVNGVPLSGRRGPMGDVLVAALERHDIAQLTIRQHAPARELFQVVRWLQREPTRAGAGRAGGAQGFFALALWYVDVTLGGEERAARSTLGVQGPFVQPSQVVARHLAAAHAATKPNEVRVALLALDTLLDAYASTGQCCPVATALVGLHSLVVESRWMPAVRETAAPHLACLRTRCEDLAVASLAVRRLAELAPSARPPLLAALGWLGEPGGAALVAHLLAAETLAARRVYFDALRTLRLGVPLLVAALRHTQWYVARNAAALLGEMQVTDADAELVFCLDHPEPRVRAATATSLLALRTPHALAALAARLGDEHPVVHASAASAAALLSARKPATGALHGAATEEPSEGASGAGGSPAGGGRPGGSRGRALSAVGPDWSGGPPPSHGRGRSDDVTDWGDDYG